MNAFELWGMGLFGWILYNIWQLKTKGKAFDLNNNGLDSGELKAYAMQEWPSILFSLVLTIAMTAYHLSEELYTWCIQVAIGREWINDGNYPFIKAFHLLTGSLAAFIQCILSKIPNGK